MNQLWKPRKLDPWNFPLYSIYLRVSTSPPIPYDKTPVISVLLTLAETSYQSLYTSWVHKLYQRENTYWDCTYLLMTNLILCTLALLACGLKTRSNSNIENMSPLLNSWYCGDKKCGVLPACVVVKNGSSIKRTALEHGIPGNTSDRHLGKVVHSTRPGFALDLLLALLSWELSSQSVVTDFIEMYITISCRDGGDSRGVLLLEQQAYPYQTIAFAYYTI